MLAQFALWLVFVPTGLHWLQAPLRQDWAEAVSLAKQVLVDYGCLGYWF